LYILLTIFAMQAAAALSGTSKSLSYALVLVAVIPLMIAISVGPVYVQGDSCSQGQLVVPATATRWTRVHGALKVVSSHGGEESVWGVNGADQIYRYRDNVWQQIDGSLKHIDTGRDGEVWGVNLHGTIFRWQDGRWRTVNGELKVVAVGAYNVVWGVNSIDDIFQYQGDGNWKHIPGKLKYISVDSAGKEVWGVNSGDQVFKYQGNNSWQLIDGSLKQITVSIDGQVSSRPPPPTQSSILYPERTPNPKTQKKNPTFLSGCMALMVTMTFGCAALTSACLGKSWTAS